MKQFSMQSSLLILILPLVVTSHVLESLQSGSSDGVIPIHHLSTLSPTFGRRDASETSAPTSTAAALILQQNPQCVVLSSALSICTSLTPGFTTLAPTQQAECLCYSETTFVPDLFDGAVKTCAEFAQTAAPAAYGAIVDLEGFCESVSDGTCCGEPLPMELTTSVSVTAIIVSTASLSTATLSTATLDQCQAVQNLLASCTAATPGFATLPATAQASCLCYAGRPIPSWAPTSFDGAVDACAKEASGLNNDVYSAVTAMQGFCDQITAAEQTTYTTIPNNPITSAITSAMPTSILFDTRPPPPMPTPFPYLTAAQPTPTSDRQIQTTLTVPIPPAAAAGTGTVTKNSGRQLANKPEVTLVSFVCALVVLFLC